jgi:hypothetical protein
MRLLLSLLMLPVVSVYCQSDFNWYRDRAADAGANLAVAGGLAAVSVRLLASFVLAFVVVQYLTTICKLASSVGSSANDVLQTIPSEVKYAVGGAVVGGVGVLAFPAVLGVAAGVGAAGPVAGGLVSQASKLCINCLYELYLYMRAKQSANSSPLPDLPSPDSRARSTTFSWMQRRLSRAENSELRTPFLEADD